MPLFEQKIKKNQKNLTFYVDKTKKILYNSNCKLNVRKEKYTNR